MEDQQLTALKEMADQADEIFFTFIPNEKRFQYVSKAFEYYTNGTCADLYNDPLSFLKLIYPDDLDYVKKNWDYVLKNKINYMLDFRIIRPDGVQRWVRLKIYPVVENGELKHVSGILEDDSARKNNMFNMEKVNGWKNTTLEIIGHDLRGPISIVNLLAQAITNKLPQNEFDDIREWTKMIAEISQRNVKLIHNLIKRESLDSVKTDMSKERIELVWEINQSMEIYMNSQLRAERRFRFTHSHDKIYAEIDSMKYLQAINNLVSNAIKFTKKNGLIEVHIEKLERTVVVSVSDNGIGIPKSMQPIIFNKYTEAVRPGTDGQEPIGLGMWIVKSYTEMHGGRVWFESEENVGSTFYMEVPIEK